MKLLGNESTGSTLHHGGDTPANTWVASPVLLGALRVACEMRQYT